MKNKFLYCLCFLSLGILLAACGPTTQEAYIRNLDNLPAQYTNLAALPKEPIQIDYNRQLVVGKLEIGQFEWGKSRFHAIEFPDSSRPYYLVVKSYLVSPITNPFRYRGTGKDHTDPRVFYPYLVMLDKDSNIISHSRAEDFEIKSTRRIRFILGNLDPTGHTWLQAAFRIDPAIRPAPKFAVISTLSDVVGNTGTIPSSYWPSHSYTSLVLPVTVSGVPIPVSIPMLNYQGPTILLHFANVGELQIHLVDPQDLLRTTYGKKMAWRKQKAAEPGKIYQVKGLNIPAPDVPGYGYLDLSSADLGRMDFSREIPSGRGISVVFAEIKRYSFGQVESAIKEHKSSLTDLTYQVKDMALMGKTCKRIDFEGKVRDMFFATIRGYDIHCYITRKTNAGFAVRIGGNVTTNPAYLPNDKLPADVGDFPNGISLNEDVLDYRLW